MFNPDAGKRLLGALSITAILVAWSVRASGADTYSGGQLTIPSLAIGNAIYSDVIVDISAVLGGPAGTAPAGSIDSYNPLTGQLSAQAVTLGATTVYNGLATVGNVVSIGSVSGADTFDGAHLAIPYAQVNGILYSSAVVTVSAILAVANGLPTAPWDLYNTSNKQLTIAAVTYKGKVYTNVTVTINSIVSVGAGGGTAQTISFPMPSFVGAQFNIADWATLAATASSGLPVTYYVTTPSICGFYNTTAQEQYAYLSYTAAGAAGGGVLGGPTVATDVIQANTVSGTVTMVNNQAVSLPMGLLTQLTPFPNTDPGYVPPYPNFHFGPANNGYVFDDVFFGNGAPLFDFAGLAYQVPGDIINLYSAGGGYFYGDSFNSTGLTGGVYSYAPQGNALVGLSAGLCQITAFQSGNGTYASARPVTVQLGVN